MPHIVYISGSVSLLHPHPQVLNNLGNLNLAAGVSDGGGVQVRDEMRCAGSEQPQKGNGFLFFF